MSNRPVNPKGEISLPNRNSVALGRELAQARKTAKLGTQQELGELTGVGKNTIWHYEKGKSLPGIDFVARFCELSGADFHALLRLRLEAAGVIGFAISTWQIWKRRLEGEAD